MVKTHNYRLIEYLNIFLSFLLILPFIKSIFKENENRIVSIIKAAMLCEGEFNEKNNH